MLASLFLDLDNLHYLINVFMQVQCSGVEITGTLLKMNTKNIELVVIIV